MERGKQFKGSRDRQPQAQAGYPARPQQVPTARAQQDPRSRRQQQSGIRPQPIPEPKAQSNPAFSPQPFAGPRSQAGFKPRPQQSDRQPVQVASRPTAGPQRTENPYANQLPGRAPYQEPEKYYSAPYHSYQQNNTYDSYGQSGYGQNAQPGYGQAGYGSLYGGSYNYEQNFGQDYKQYDQSYGQDYGQGYGQDYNQNYDQGNYYQPRNTLGGDPFEHLTQPPSWTKWIAPVLSGIVFIACLIILLTLLS